MGFPGGSDGKGSACSVEDPGSIPGSGRSPREGNGYLLQYACLENPMDRAAWWATPHRVTKSQTWLSDCFFFTVKTIQANPRCGHKAAPLSVQFLHLSPPSTGCSFLFWLNWEHTFPRHVPLLSWPGSIRSHGPEAPWGSWPHVTRNPGTGSPGAIQMSQESPPTGSGLKVLHGLSVWVTPSALGFL